MINQGSQIPQVAEGARGSAVDIYSRLLLNRMVFLTGDIDDEKANVLVAQILYLDTIDPTKDIHMIINRADM